MDALGGKKPRGLGAQVDRPEWSVECFWKSESPQRLRRCFLKRIQPPAPEDAEVSVNWTEGATVPAPVSGALLPSSPFSVADSFGEDVVPPVQVHDPVLQVEFPFVLTSVNLGRKRGGRQSHLH